MSMIVNRMRVTITALVSTKLEVLNVNVHLDLWAQDVREILMNAYQILAQYLVLKIVFNLLMIIIVTVNLDIWEGTVMLKSTSAQILHARMVVYAPRFKADMSAYAMKGFMAKTVNTQATLVTRTPAKMVDIVELQKSEAMFVTVHQDYQALTVKLIL